VQIGDDSFEILVLDVDYEKYLNEAGDLVLDGKVEESFGRFLYKKAEFQT
jgi:hypothetical protein